MFRLGTVGPVSFSSTHFSNNPFYYQNYKEFPRTHHLHPPLISHYTLRLHHRCSTYHLTDASLASIPMMRSLTMPLSSSSSLVYLAHIINRSKIDRSIDRLIVRFITEIDVFRAGDYKEETHFLVASSSSISLIGTTCFPRKRCSYSQTAPNFFSHLVLKHACSFIFLEKPGSLCLRIFIPQSTYSFFHIRRHQ